ncbi:DUF1127 domain-containing protein [Acuticoccus sp. M5D2P5]|uniref:DUF1127 domain-containing protein n=1 Tax=Acuticoccus kalidii TaxID=2910977 RepID=UPI001F468884|nr:DUF1127 domain-containing protein [Acuticoccus kalidii]MCF3932139.1 DUF1127 domain-containing protein [Acuticoccus kalidii]
MDEILARATWPVGWGSRKAALMARLWLNLWSERRALAMLDDRLLKDIGVTPDEARYESERAPWDAPTKRMMQGW